MASNLKSRLARIRKDRLAEAGDGAEPRADSATKPRPAFLEGWEELCPFLYARDFARSLDFPASVDPSPFIRHGSGETSLASGRLRFFDLETTGLSGGSGTIAFLASVGRLEGGSLHQRQLFLADYPGEGPFIEALLAALGAGPDGPDGPDGPEGPVLASYNGRSFDFPLLRTRCVMNGLAIPDWPHLDLLHPARRLWKRIHGGAGLGLLEATVLGHDRGPDVPGSLIPGIYFDFLRNGEAAPMAEVVSHNAEDVHSLAALFAVFLDVLARPLEWAEREDVDRAGLAAILFRTGREGEGEALLQAAARGGDEAAGIRLVRRLARAGRDEERAAALDILGPGPLCEIERAKYLEHRAGDYAAALAATTRALEGLGPAMAEARLEAGRAGRIREGLEIRKARLQGKRARGEGR